MNTANLTKQTKRKKASKAHYSSPLRAEQARLTQDKIQKALLELFEEGGSVEGITYKAVAKRAGVTEMTVFRYYPERPSLLKSLWEKITEKLGKDIVMPDTAEVLLNQNEKLYLGFDRNPEVAVASIASIQGREMRASLNETRRAAFLKLVTGLNPKLDRRQKTKWAAVLQLLHSAYAWDSMKQQWNMSGAEISDATTSALQLILEQIKKGKNV